MQSGQCCFSSKEPQIISGHVGIGHRGQERDVSEVVLSTVWKQNKTYKSVTIAKASILLSLGPIPNSCKLLKLVIKCVLKKKKKFKK